MSKPFRIFTDGSAIGNPGPGGWAAVLIERQEAGDFRFKSMDDCL